MKKFIAIIAASCTFYLCAAQKPSPDSIVVRPLDTVKGTPKLEGGALIDTIHSKDKKTVQPKGKVKKTTDQRRDTTKKTGLN